MEYTVRTRKKMKGKAQMVKRASVGAELHHLDEDKCITTDPGENSKRRTLKLIKKQNSWGFTLQTYGIKHKKTNDIEIMTYVDYVEFDGAAWIAGMRRGDVILSVNGEKVGEITHQQLVNKIRQAGDTLR
ncbi:SH3 and multiple ankyrin repeat domains protein 2-like [Ruditapes philippinarum]|uniref:SH3 and multiple ankyrin repeat domains protein 2-like n=1 Tax=Ruditapes philippinarum TaxID=129788 RepID=UPI00295BC0C6|nr:SH3 and multiple ankyrin repeat domains protein 2-like [Ruditapes philippinarum]